MMSLIMIVAFYLVIIAIFLAKHVLVPAHQIVLHASHLEILLQEFVAVLWDTMRLTLQYAMSAIPHAIHAQDPTLINAFHAREEEF